MDVPPRKRPTNKCGLVLTQVERVIARRTILAWQWRGSNVISGGVLAAFASTSLVRPSLYVSQVSGPTHRGP